MSKKKTEKELDIDPSLAKDARSLEDVLNDHIESIKIPINAQSDKQEFITGKEAIARKMFENAAKGDVSAYKTIMEITKTKSAEIAKQRVLVLADEIQKTGMTDSKALAKYGHIWQIKRSQMGYLMRRAKEIVRRNVTEKLEKSVEKNGQEIVNLLQKYTPIALKVFGDALEDKDDKGMPTNIALRAASEITNKGLPQNINIIKSNGMVIDVDPKDIEKIEKELDTIFKRQ